MRKKLVIAGLAVAAGVLTPAAGSAQRTQRFPGVPGSDGMSAAANRAEYYADVLMHTNEILSRWREAWAADALDDLLELYTEDATFIFTDDAVVRGREAIREKLASLLQETGEVQAAYSDFDASGRMGFISGMMHFQMQDARSTRTVTGIHLTVLIRRGRDWRIRTQLFRLDEGAVPEPRS